MKEKLLYLMLILFVSASVFAQTGGGSAAFTIKGQVVDSLSNESVPYATLRIALASAPQNPVKLLACDDDGKFTATMNKPGKYVMTMESLGKVPAKKTFTLSESKKVVNFGKLFMHDDTQQLKEVTVTAQKPLVKVEVDKLTYSMMQKGLEVLSISLRPRTHCKDIRERFVPMPVRWVALVAVVMFR